MRQSILFIRYQLLVSQDSFSLRTFCSLSLSACTDYMEPTGVENNNWKTNGYKTIFDYITVKL